MSEYLHGLFCKPPSLSLSLPLSPSLSLSLPLSPSLSLSLPLRLSACLLMFLPFSSFFPRWQLAWRCTCFLGLWPSGGTDTLGAGALRGVSSSVLDVVNVPIVYPFCALLAFEFHLFSFLCAALSLSLSLSLSPSPVSLFFRSCFLSFMHFWSLSDKGCQKIPKWDGPSFKKQRSQSMSCPDIKRKFALGIACLRSQDTFAMVNHLVFRFSPKT